MKKGMIGLILAIVMGMTLWASTGRAADLVIDGPETNRITEDATYSGYVYVGDYTGENRLTVSNGVHLHSYTGYIGREISSTNNSAWVAGEGSIWSTDLLYFVGYYGSSNSLTISDGGQMISTIAHIGGMPGSSNCSAIVTDVGSAWSNSVSVTVGRYGPFSSLIVTNGGTVTAPEGRLGLVEESHHNSVCITGSHSMWELSEAIYVGDASSSNHLVIRDGGMVSAGEGSVGYKSTAASNQVVVSGIDSSWLNSNNLSIGASGSQNMLTIADGGRVKNSFGMVGRNAGATNNIAVVRGPHSSWINASSLYAGYYGSGNRLEISDGGTVQNGYGYIGDNVNATANRAVVSGPGSGWTNLYYLSVGCYGSGNSLVISNGGCVANSLGLIGRYASANSNSVWVSGAVWTNSAALRVGSSEGNSGNALTISNGGLVYADSAVVYTNNRLQFAGGQLQLENSMLTVSGTLIIDGAPALMGSLVMADSGVFSVLHPGSSLLVSGDVTLNGTLEVRSGGASVAAGDSFPLFDCSGGISGEFASLDLEALDEGLEWDTTHLYSDGTLQIVESGSQGQPLRITFDEGRVSFVSSNEWSYTLQACSNLVDSLWTDVTNASGTGTEMGWDVLEKEASTFYRVQMKSVK